MVAVLYLGLALIGLVFVQLLTQATVPSGLLSFMFVFGDVLVFYGPVVVSIGVLWSVVWISYQWRISNIPLFMALNGQPRRRLLWAAQPFLLINCLILFCFLHQVSPAAGERLHSQAQQSIVSQIPTSRVLQWGKLVLGAEERSGSGLKNVFMASGDFSVFSRTGFKGEGGELVLKSGVIRDVQQKDEWNLKFSHARIQHFENGLGWSVHMLTSPRLVERISQVPEPEALRRELYKRSFQPAILWFLAMSVLVLTLRGWAIGVTLCGAVLSWWLGMRFFDHLVHTLGPIGSAMGPLAFQILIFCATLFKWRDQ